MKQGNNRWGSKGCVKCDECRRRKTKCVADANNPLGACRDCKKRKAMCEKQFPVPTARMSASAASASDYSLSPSPSDTSSLFVPPRSPSSSVDIQHHQLANAPTSVLFEHAADYARQLERTYPNWTPKRIIPLVRNSMEHGSFGELRDLFSHRSLPPTPPSPPRHLPQQQLVSDVFPTFPPAQVYPQNISQVPRGYSNTVNPATLTMQAMPPMPSPFNYTEELQRVESPYSNIDSDSTAAPDFEMPAHYGYVGMSATAHENMRHDPRDIVAIQPATMRYNGDYGYNH